MIKVQEAINYMEASTGKKLAQIDLAKKIFEGDASEKTLAVMMSNLVNGKTKRVSPEVVRNICSETGVDANFLFQIEPMNEKKRADYEQANS